MRNYYNYAVAGVAGWLYTSQN